MSREWDELKDALRRSPTPDAMKAAGEAFARYAGTQPAKSKPTLVNLNLGRGYPNAVPLDKISEQLANNPNFYNLMRKVTGGS
jgi:hypothetical protein